MKLSITILSTLLSLFACGACLAQQHKGDILILDPAEVTRLGFDPVTDEVWRAPAIDDRQLSQERLALGKAAPASVMAAVEPIWTSVQATDFQFRDASAEYTDNGHFELACLAGSPNRQADASIQFPNDRRLTWMDVWAVDASPTASLGVALYEICQNYADPSRRTVIQLANVDTGTAFSGGKLWQNRYVGDNRWVRSAICAYEVRATFSSCNAGTNLRLQKVRVLWSP